MWSMHRIKKFESQELAEYFSYEMVELNFLNYSHWACLSAYGVQRSRISYLHKNK